MLLLIGLGNPGKEYESTRHNCGFMVVDAFASSHNASFSPQSKFKSEIAEFLLHERKIIVAKPQTFMNLSGESVGTIARFYKIEPKNIWVVADDLDLPLGKIRVRHNGETGGHHGLDSIKNALQTSDFSRIRLGIRGSELRQEHVNSNIDTSSFVTSNFTAQEQLLIDRAINLTVNLIEEGIASGELTAHSYEVDGFDERVGVAS